MLCSFSLISNWRELSDTSSKSEFPCLNGLRILCSIWTVFAHRILLLILAPFLNHTSFRQVLANALLGDIVYSSWIIIIFPFPFNTLSWKIQDQHVLRVRCGNAEPPEPRGTECTRRIARAALGCRCQSVSDFNE